MNLRKTLLVGAAALAAGVLSITATATASTLSNISVNGSSTPGAAAITGTFKGGTASFGGGTYGCSGGSVSGTVQRGPVGAGAEMTFPAGGLNITCSTPVGSATIDNTCAVTVDFSGAPNVHTGLTDTGTGSKFHRVAGTADFDWPSGATNPCVRVRVVGGLCTVYVDGTPAAYFDELVETGDVQTLGLNGVGGSLVNATAGCYGQISGTFTLNNIGFWVKPAAGSIDFAAASPTGSTLANTSVNGSSTPGAEAITGTFKGGTFSFGGGTYGCSGGSVNGTVQRGPVGAGAEMTFPAGGLNLTCSNPYGNTTIDNTCPVTVDFSGAPNVHTGLTDTGTGSKFHRVAGGAAFPWPGGATNPCVRYRMVGGLCTAYWNGNPAAYFDELVKTGGVQTLGLNGVGGSFVNATAGCFGQISGNFTLNDLRFWVKPTTGGGNIDFQP